MDIYDFLNSRDIAEHCRKIGKIWTPFEMAVLINRSHRTTAEKHAGWRTIIAEYADMPTPVNDSGGSYESLHKKLMEWIDCEEHLFEVFKKPEEGALYAYNDWSGSRNNPECAFDNFETALSDAAKHYYGDRHHGVHVIRMTKSFINDSDHMTAFFNNDNNLDLVWIVGGRKQSELVDIFNKGYLFDAYVEIPMPFERGDILTYKKGWDKEDDGIVFVFDSFEHNVIKLPKEKYRDTKRIKGFYVCENGDLLDHDSPYDLEQIEYYRGELKDSRRLLHYISLFMKGKLRLPELLSIQNRIKLSLQLDNWVFREYGNRDLPEVIRGDYYQEDKAIEADVMRKPATYQEAFDHLLKYTKITAEQLNEWPKVNTIATYEEYVYGASGKFICNDTITTESGENFLGPDYYGYPHENFEDVVRREITDFGYSDTLNWSLEYYQTEKAKLLNEGADISEEECVLNHLIKLQKTVTQEPNKDEEK